ncbi:hypothetical protein L9F63_023932, partial [Diploptera punctata]
GQLCVLLVAGCLLAQLEAQETTTQDSSLSETWISGNTSQDVYEIKSVQFEIGVVEQQDDTGDNDTTAEPITKDKLTETKVAFLVPPAYLFNTSQSATTEAP